MLQGLVCADTLVRNHISPFPISQTTLLNHLLKERGSKSIAVIENEFGEVNIDRELGERLT